ncbi:hypothetical protein CMV_008403 [Castanea mollissima]|uniref:Thioesterase domain-containing protein n=1 Tax=Castanea mollissima TaxID=60419 RepID=A0A8J4RMN5_9ROSI|nr:hypothetical protein CMV_008403 [Castanea mollissima]
MKVKESKRVSHSNSIPDFCNNKYFYSHLIRDAIKPDQVLRGRITCLLTVTPVLANFYASLHGGAMAAIAEMLSIACARTVVAEDKDIFLGDMNISYLSGAPIHDFFGGTQIAFYLAFEVSKGFLDI